VRRSEMSGPRPISHEGSSGGEEGAGRLKPLEMPEAAAAAFATQARVRVAGALIVALGAVVIAVVVSLASIDGAKGRVGGRDLGSPVGWVAVLGAIFLFGSTAIMFKNPPGARHDSSHEPPDPVLFQAFNALGIFATALPLVVFEFARAGDDTFGFFDPLAIVGAVTIIVICFFATKAVQLIGLATAPAVWSGIGMIVAFVWGRIFFKEGIQSVALALLAILLLVAGVLLIALSQSRAQQRSQRVGETAPPSKPLASEKAGTSIQLEKVEPESAEKIAYAPVSSASAEDGVGLKNEDRPVPSSRNRLAFGLLCCAAAGALDGSLMVPYKMHLSAAGRNAGTDGSGRSSLSDTFAYLASFSLGALLIAPVLIAIGAWRVSYSGGVEEDDLALGQKEDDDASSMYEFSVRDCSVQEIGENLDDEIGQDEGGDDDPEMKRIRVRVPPLSFCGRISRKCRNAVVPGMVTGILWTMGNFLSVHATKYLGMAVGFPLTQTCILINAVWGIAFFGEMELSCQRRDVLLPFCLALFCIILGAVLLSLAG